MLHYLILVFTFIFFQHPEIAQTPSVKIITSEIIFDDSPFNACHASTLVELPNQKIMAAWFAGSNEGNKDLCIWAATKTNGKWSVPINIANGIQNDTVTSSTLQRYLKYQI